MDINKWKSIAVRIDDYKILKALGVKDERKPVELIAIMTRKEIERRAKDKNLSVDKYLKKLMDDAKKPDEYKKALNGISKK
jgi:phosphotransacetylase